MKITRAQLMKGIGKELLPWVEWIDNYGHALGRLYYKRADGWYYTIGAWDTPRKEFKPEILEAISALIN